MTAATRIEGPCYPGDVEEPEGPPVPTTRAQARYQREVDALLVEAIAFLPPNLERDALRLMTPETRREVEP